VAKGLKIIWSLLRYIKGISEQIMEDIVKVRGKEKASIFRFLWNQRRI